MKWYNDITKLFMSRGYLDKGQTIDEKIDIIAKHSTNILGKDSDFENKLKQYIRKGWYIIPTPVWKNFKPNTSETAISCVVGDTWINTSTGGKMAKNIQVGDLVLTHKNRFKKVINVIPSKDKGDIYKLKVGTRMTNLFITGNHVVLTNLGWVRVDELDVNKHLIAVNGDLEYDSREYTIDLKSYTDYKFIVENRLIKKATENSKDTGKTSVDYYAKVNENIEVDEDLAWALGVWFAEGSLTINNKKEPNGIRITLNNNDELHIAKKWLGIIKSKFNVNGSIYITEVERNGKLNSWVNVNINSKIIGNLFKSFGEGCKNKKAPDWVLDLPKEKLSFFLNGLLIGDGTFRKNECKVTLANPELILQVYNIGLKLGMSMSLQMQDKPSKLSTTKHVYTITFREYINSINRHSCNSGIKFNDGLIYCPIKTLEKTDKVEDVYDFTVEEDHSFSCAGVVVHNCFGVYIEDSVESIVLKAAEVALQNKIGGGSSGTFQDVRGRGEKIGNEGQSNGSVSMMEIYQTMSGVISQPNRRGHFSATQDIEHLDAEEFLDSRSEGHVIQDLSVGVKISDNFIKHLLLEKNRNIELFKKLVKQKYDTGFPYIFFSDNVNKNTVDVYKDKGCTIHHSNMCQEIMLPNNPKETFICNLLGMNVELFDEWRDTDAVEVGIFFMDSMLTDFINKTERKKELNEDYYNVLYKPSVTFAKRHRAMGMGMSGLHSFLQSKNIAFNSLQGRAYNKLISKTIHDQAYKASEKMALEYGKPDMLKEDKYKRRHTTLLAVAPNSSSSFIVGQQSQSIEPYISNYYIRDVAKVRTSIRNPYLKKLLEELGKDTEEVWSSILKNQGSVQHLDFLTENQKEVFKTFIEIPQVDIIDMASDRQKYIDQGQSLNLMVGSDTNPDEVAYWILYAWKKGIKTLYYQLNVSAAQDFTNQKVKTECVSCSG